MARPISESIRFALMEKHPRQIREVRQLVLLLKEYENLQQQIQKKIAEIDAATKKEEDEKNVKPKI